MNFGDRFAAAVAERGNPCLVGLDPHPSQLPEEFAAARAPVDNGGNGAGGPTTEERARDVERFLLGIVEVIAGRVPAVKPQSAFFELYGAPGAAAWDRVVRASHAAGLLVIGDVKRGDIDSTARAYAQAFLEGVSASDRDGCCDAITVNPYLGTDSITPFLETCARSERGIFVLVRTSNPGAKTFQDHGDPPLYLVVADKVNEWGSALVGNSNLSSVGAVVGATHPRELALLRARMPHTPFLIPGYGAQGASGSDIAGGFLPGGRGAIVNSSRGILFAHRQPRHAGRHWKDAARAALDEMIAELNAVIAAHSA
ncbi:MAG: orotidine-5'-phosphate decarboxylase [Planctomycetota bacterium]